MKDLDILDRLQDLAAARIPKWAEEAQHPRLAVLSPDLAFDEFGRLHCKICLQRIPIETEEIYELGSADSIMIPFVAPHTCVWECGLCGLQHDNANEHRTHTSLCAARRRPWKR